MANKQEEDRNIQDQEDEITALQSIYDKNFVCLDEEDERISATSDRSVPSTSQLKYNYEVNVQIRGVVPLEIQLPCLHAGDRDHKSDSQADLTSSISFTISHVPPLRLQFRYPKTYPSTDPPAFNIKNAFLSTHQLHLLQQKLLSVWEEYAGSPIIFTWCDWLSENTLPFLNFKNPIQLISLNNGENNEKDSQKQERGVLVANDSTELVSLMKMLKDYDIKTANFEFAQEQHQCSICYESNPGSRCIRFTTCHHVFCKNCINQYFTLSITEGDIAAVKCPACKQPADEEVVCKAVSRETFKRYCDLIQKRKLEERSDVAWCPRASCVSNQVPAYLIDKITPTLAVCSKCGHAFCVECKRAWHGVAHCANVFDKFKNAGPEEREALLKKYGQNLFSEMQNKEWMEENAKPCPRCKSGIEKNGGCNHMTCRKCGYEFCWLCLGVYTVDHFFRPGGCKQFTEFEVPDYDAYNFGFPVYDEENDFFILGSYAYNYRHNFNF